MPLSGTIREYYIFCILTILVCRYVSVCVYLCECGTTWRFLGMLWLESPTALFVWHISTENNPNGMLDENQAKNTYIYSYK